MKAGELSRRSVLAMRAWLPALGAMVGLVVSSPSEAGDESEPALAEVLVTSTRQLRRIADEPTRVEVLDQDELEEKLAASPGDVSMLLNELPGLRIQQTAPGLGAVNIRIEGLRGRYSQILADGLPLYGGQSSGTSLLQIPPLDLRQVEVLKGVSSALYGPSALGGVINFVSRRPDGVLDVIVNRTSRHETDLAAWWSDEPTPAGWTYSVTTNINRQSAQDINNDGWADMPGFKRASIRPRLYWKDGNRSDVYVTVGATIEDRQGGTIPGGTGFIQKDSTHRYDAGFIGHWALPDAMSLTLKASDAENLQHQTIGTDDESSHASTANIEATVDGASGPHSWIAGAAFERDSYRNSTLPAFDLVYSIPAIFVQDEYKASQAVTLSASARLDHHDRYGTFLSPRWALLWRPGGEDSPWRVRASVGTGYFAPTPLTEETESTGLARVEPIAKIRAERAQGVSLDVGRLWTLDLGSIETNLTVFGSKVTDAVNLVQTGIASPRFSFINDQAPTRNFGTELLLRWHAGPMSLMLAHGYLDSTEFPADASHRRPVPLNPRHTGTFTLIYEATAIGRIGLEGFYVGTQSLVGTDVVNPYLTTSPPYFVLGVSLQRKIGPLTAFLNLENLTDRRLTRYQPLLLPQPASNGSRTVDAWGPLDGRVVNLGLRWRTGDRD